MPNDEFVTAAGHRLEWRQIRGAHRSRPTLVFLHQGLGCAAMWRDFPERLVARTGWDAVVYSRWGYGRSDARHGQWPVSFMHDEALTALPEVLAAADVADPVLVGHSDGASIALIFAGRHPDAVRALILVAPHVFVEDVCLHRIEDAGRAFEEGTLRAGLRRYHGDNTESMFRGWQGAWLASDFRTWDIRDSTARIRVPTLVVQGELDEYGTLAQVDEIAARSSGTVERLVLAGCGHEPQRDRPDEVLDAMARFVLGLPATG